MTKENDLLQSIDGDFQTYKEAEQKELDEQRKYQVVSSPTLDRDKLLTCKEVSRICPLSEPKLRKLCKNSKENGFPCFFSGNRAYIFIDELYKWLVAHSGERF